MTIFCLKEKYTKSEATAVARILTSTGTMTHEHYSSVHGKFTENINDLFAPYEKYPYVILIEGAAGIGKTTLCKEIAIQWANKNTLKNKELLFLLFMHDPKIKTLTNIELLVKHFFKSEILVSKISDWLIATDGKYLTIIIDGYSEDCGNSFIYDDIIGRKMLTQCGMVITSRSPASSHLSKIINRRALVMGFTKNNQITFINTALKGLNSKIKYINDYLQSNPITDNLCKFPLIMTMLLWFVVNEEEINNLPKTQASLIQKYIATITKKKIVPSLTDMPYNPYDQVIKDLSQFAFIAVQEDQLTFTVDEILELCENHFQVYWHRLGLLKMIYEFGLLNKISCEAQSVFCEIFHFNHVTIQEYLTAYYISFLPDSELLKLLHGTFWNIRYFDIWVMYVGITGGKNSVFRLFLSGSQLLESSGISAKNKIQYCLYQLYCMKEADGDLDNILLRQNIDLNHQQLSHSHLHTLAVLLSYSTNKQWKNLNLSNCNIDSQGCAILCEIFSCTELKFETVNISYNNFNWESFLTICCMFKFWHTNKFVFSIDSLYDALYDAVTMNEINSFTAMLEETFLNDVFSNNILLLTYLANQRKLIVVYSAPTCFRWFEWANCKLNESIIKQIKTFIESKVRSKTFKFSFNCSLIDNVIHANIKKLSILLSDIKNVQLCGSYLHSKGAYLLNIASTFECHYNSPQELVADYLAAILCHGIQSTTPYLESLPADYVSVVKNLLQSALSMRAFDISHNYINGQIAKEIQIFLSLTSGLQTFYASHNNLLEENIISILKGLQNSSTLTEFNISYNNATENVAGNIAKVLSHNSKLQKLYLSNNSFKTVGITKIAKALQNVSTLTVFGISNNSVGEEAADDIATVISHNNKLQQLDLSDNSFKTIGIAKIAKALQNLSTLTLFDIRNNSVGEEAADDIAKVLSHNNKLQELYLTNNSFKTIGITKIAKALQNVSTLTVFSISNNNVDEEAADDIATVISHNNKLQQLDLSDNSFKTIGIAKIAKALQNLSTLTLFDIRNNSVGEEAADDIAKVLSHNNKLQELYLTNNSFKTIGITKIAKALQNVSTLTVFSISNNNVDEEAADDIATVISHNNKLQQLDLSDNSFKTIGIAKIAKALQNLSTLTLFDIRNNSVGEEAADDIAKVLSHNNKLQELYLTNNSFKTIGITKIAKALQNVSTLTVFGISNNSVGEEAADDIAKVLSHNNKLQRLDLDDNNFKTIGITKIAKALQNVSTLTVFDISNNSVGEEAADDIAKVLSHNNKLQ